MILTKTQEKNSKIRANPDQEKLDLETVLKKAQIKVLNSKDSDPKGNFFTDKSNKKNKVFFQTVASTETIKHPGISAAGASSELLSYTAALDAEYLVHGEVKSLENLPVSPAGIVSPALITKECLSQCDAQIEIINAGIKIKPQTPLIDLGDETAKSVETGEALPIDTVIKLFQKGKEHAINYIKSHADLDYLVFAECVVGGTTTALGLLKALGYECFEMVSSSIPTGNHKLKEKLINEGYKKAIERNDFSGVKVEENPLLAVSAMGDPMQAVVTGMTIGALASDKKVLLAGGSQMIAIASLIRKILGEENKLSKHLAIATSPWVVNDQSAKIADLAAMVCPNIPIFYADLEEAKEIDSYPEIFRFYDQGHVKEGVGAGAALVCAALS